MRQCMRSTSTARQCAQARSAPQHHRLTAARPSHVAHSSTNGFVASAVATAEPSHPASGPEDLKSQMLSELAGLDRGIFGVPASAGVSLSKAVTLSKGQLVVTAGGQEGAHSDPNRRPGAAQHPRGADQRFGFCSRRLAAAVLNHHNHGGASGIPHRAAADQRVAGSHGVAPGARV